jgi:hypothetical protein
VHLATRADLPHHARDQLRGGGAGADHADAAASQVNRRVPARRVQALAGKTVEAGDVGPAHLAQRPGAADEVARLEPLARGGADHPAATGLVEAGFFDGLAELQVRGESVLLGAMHHVGLDLRRRGEAA